MLMGSAWTGAMRTNRLLRSRLLIACVAVLATSRIVVAFSPGKPTKHEVFSQNREYALVVDPDSKNIIYPASDRTRELWSFPFEDAGYRLSNDGKVVAATAGRYFFIDPAHDPSGIRFISTGPKISRTTALGHYVPARGSDIETSPHRSTTRFEFGSRK
jgi:hypothetical protein